eukprot:CAMPEP_0114530368 /NCGR_PEP_ID=MMETSP0109-20121206/25406_1 /TAXON_ID=29199 /ORGANISM="Chlorarachnion reptans, Strain CCCM449" /LENGTH=430 /DNA_ID=CAMNT_0001712983 /DNA_START=28 /DNA_END=1320 /DNA_ORIENTATION=+
MMPNGSANPSQPTATSQMPEGYAGYNPNGMPQMSAGIDQNMSIANCSNCDTSLTYPSKSLYIQCPKCAHTMNPQAPDTNYINCLGCSTLLSHPPSSLTIQCPKCLMIMELPVRGANGGGSDPLSKGDSRKRRKDPNAPRRASNAYMIFCKERRAQLKEERPDLPFGKFGEMWREMSAEERKPYEEKAATDRDRFKREMETYNTELAERRKRNRIESQVDPDPNGVQGSLQMGGSLRGFGMSSQLQGQSMQMPQMQYPHINPMIPRHGIMDFKGMNRIPNYMTHGQSDRGVSNPSRAHYENVMRQRSMTPGIQMSAQGMQHGMMPQARNMQRFPYDMSSQQIASMQQYGYQNPNMMNQPLQQGGLPAAGRMVARMSVPASIDTKGAVKSKGTESRKAVQGSSVTQARNETRSSEPVVKVEDGKERSAKGES